MSNDKPLYQVGECRVDVARRELRVRDVPVPIGMRAFDIIEALVQSAGALVTKEELMQRIWQGAIVEENTLQVHISAVRKALGANRSMLKTESGRGYRLVGSWTGAGNQPPPIAVDLEPPPKAALLSLTNLPEIVAGPIGRSTASQQLHDLLSAYRVVTLTGPGGIGKTTLAVMVARNVLASFEHGISLVELASLANPELVPSAVMGVLRTAHTGTISPEAVARAIGDRQLLLLLDNCEHLIDAVADLVETVVRSCPRATVLTTSREILRVDGEYVYRVPPLDVPDSDQHDPDILLGHSAVALFVERMGALSSSFAPGADHLSLAASICRQLDGIPLAIEFAVARAATLGISQVATGLQDRFGLLTKGRRTALPRHQTLRATLDWSYDLLPPAEQIILQRLAVFRGSLTLAAAMAVAADQCIPPAKVSEGVANLAMKSLVSTDSGRDIAYYRLLDTTRAYAIEKLQERGEFQLVALRHAEYYRDLLLATVDKPAAAGDQRRIDYARKVDNLRAALTWAFETPEHRSLAVALAAASPPLWLELSLLSECGEWMEKAVAALQPADRGTRLELRLQAALGFSLMFTKGMNGEAHHALTSAVDLAERLDDPDYQLRTLFGLCVFRLRVPDFVGALALAHRCAAIAGRVSDPMATPTSDWMLGLTQFCMGQIRAGLSHMQLVRDQYRPASRRSEIARFGFDLRVYALGILGLGLWIEGKPRQARSESRTAVAEALTLNHPVSLCVALWTGCLVSLWVGDFPVLEDATTRLLAHTEKHALDNYHAYGLGFAGELAIHRGDVAGGLRLMRAGLEGLRTARHQVFYSVFLGNLARQVTAAGDTAAGLKMINEAVERAERSDEAWYLPELLRLNGEVLQAASAPPPAVEQYFLRSLDLAHRQGALSWELRAATSLMRLYHRDGRQTQARDILTSVYQRFTEGFETADLIDAKHLLGTLA
jgi:predicted ATPase/DNA-binding winged helix-turn-helix (wHTH) protein